MTYGGFVQNLEYVDLRYAVTEDCTGTVNYSLKTVETETVLGGRKLELKLLEDGARLAGVMTDSGGVGAMMSSEFRRLSRGPRACHQSMLRGTYSMHYEGWINMQLIQPSQPPYFAPAIGLGAVMLDPGRDSSGGASHNWGGVQVATELLTGAFNVNTDCTGVFEYAAQIKGTPNRISGKGPLVISCDGAQVSVLMTNPPGFQYYDRVSIP
jgi:hypothetical protein